MTHLKKQVRFPNRTYIDHYRSLTMTLMSTVLSWANETFNPWATVSTSQLIQEIQAGHTEQALALIATRTDLEKPDATGQSPLHWAASSQKPNSSRICKALLAAKVKVDPADNSKHKITPLAYAVFYAGCHHSDECKKNAFALIKAGADLRAKNHMGMGVMAELARDPNLLTEVLDLPEVQNNLELEDILAEEANAIFTLLAQGLYSNPNAFDLDLFAKFPKMKAAANAYRGGLAEELIITHLGDEAGLQKWKQDEHIKQVQMKLYNSRQRRFSEAVGSYPTQLDFNRATLVVDAFEKQALEEAMRWTPPVVTAAKAAERKRPRDEAPAEKAAADAVVDVDAELSADAPAKKKEGDSGEPKAKKRRVGKK
ncbi:MAG: ankyrin repeat domain-containing protein [Candidatus Berkiellales bacterium]